MQHTYIQNINFNNFVEDMNLNMYTSGQKIERKFVSPVQTVFLLIEFCFVRKFMFTIFHATMKIISRIAELQTWYNNFEAYDLSFLYSKNYIFLKKNIKANDQN